MTPRLFLECWSAGDASDRDGGAQDREQEVRAWRLKRALFVQGKIRDACELLSGGIHTVAGDCSELERGWEGDKRPEGGDVGGKRGLGTARWAHCGDQIQQCTESTKYHDRGCGS